MTAFQTFPGDYQLNHPTDSRSMYTSTRITLKALPFLQGSSRFFNPASKKKQTILYSFSSSLLLPTLLPSSAPPPILPLHPCCCGARRDFRFSTNQSTTSTCTSHHPFTFPHAHSPTFHPTEIPPCYLVHSCKQSHLARLISTLALCYRTQQRRIQTSREGKYTTVKRLR